MVMETGSVTQAGKLLYISQPAVSRLIADLEEHVNFQLFDRRKKRLIPTVEAKLLYDEVEKAFIGLSSIEDTAQSILELKRGHLRLIAIRESLYCSYRKSLKISVNSIRISL